MMPKPITPRSVSCPAVPAPWTCLFRRSTPKAYITDGFSREISNLTQVQTRGFRGTAFDPKRNQSRSFFKEPKWIMGPLGLGRQQIPMTVKIEGRRPSCMSLHQPKTVKSDMTGSISSIHPFSETAEFQLWSWGGEPIPGTMAAGGNLPLVVANTCGVPPSCPPSLSEVCMDTLSTSVYARGATWVRWRGLQAEFCRCTSRGREQCHRVPVTTCYIPYCYNGGTCKEAVYTSDFLCVCQPGFTGLQCEINTAEKCIVGRGESYRGMWSVTRSGLSCLNWNSTALQDKKFNALKPRAGTQGLGNHNYCRNPDSDSTPWCYVYKGIQIEWEYCSLPSCPTDPDLECLKDTGKTYRGTAAQTKTGQRCLPWDFPVLRSKVYNAWRSDAVDLGLTSHSYCRNPDGDLAPWCHVYKGLKLTWEFCDIRLCEKPPLAPSISGIHAPATMNRGTCGLREQRALQFRIRGGQKSDITLQPWQAAIRVYLPRPKIYSFFCGGVLIDSCWVLSAAHCFSEGYKAENLQVTLGRTFRLQNSSSDQIFGVEDYWVHEQYDEATEDNDIMLLKLKSDNGICAVYTPEVRPVCLPEPDLVLPEWTECEISGYGKDKEFDAEYSNQVKRGHVRLWPDSQCLPEKLSNRPVTQNMMCAGDTRGLDDACKGDSGGPLVCPKDGRLTLLGIVSWGDGCGKKDVPGVYTRVTRYVSWITNKMQANSN